MKATAKKHEEVDLFVVNKPWSEELRKEFSELLKKNKEARRKTAVPKI
jgi:hypothetical protein